MNRLGRYITEEENMFLNHMKRLVENVDEVERIEISGSVKKGTGVFGISDLDLWVITNSSNFSEGDLKRLIISSKEYVVKYIKINNRILLTVKKKDSQMEPIEITIIPDLSLSRMDTARPVQSGGYLLNRILMSQLDTMDDQKQNYFRNAVKSIKFAAYLSSLHIVGFTVEIVAICALKNVGDEVENIYETMLDVLKNEKAICVIGDENCGNCARLPHSVTGQKFLCNGTGGVLIINLENLLCLLQTKAAGYLNVTDKMLYKLTKHNYMDKILEGETYPSLALVMTAMNEVEITMSKNTLKQLLADCGFKMYEKHGYYKPKKSEK